MMTTEPTDRDVNRLNEVSVRDVRLQDEGKEATTLRNGRPDRIRESKVGRNLAAIAGVYLILVFLVPLALPENTIPDRARARFGGCRVGGPLTFQQQADKHSTVRLHSARPAKTGCELVPPFPSSDRFN